MVNVLPAAIQLPSPKAIKWCIALSVIACACTLGADIAANFWSPGFVTPFQDRLGQHGPMRLWIASIGNLLTMPMHLIGLFLIYLATRPAGPFWSLAPIGLFVLLLMTYPQFIHTSWWFIGDASSCTEPQCAAVLARFEQRVRTEFTYFRIGTVLASIWLVIPILRGRTLLPRWTGVLPFVFIPAVIVLILGFLFSAVPPSLVHLFGGPFLLGILYVASGLSYLRAERSNRPA